MPDTTILRTPDGWIDRDAPTVFYKTRWMARDARRTNHPSTNRKARAVHQSTRVAKPVTVPSAMMPVDLQRKLRDRLVNVQTVDAVDADFMVNNFTYNMAASYGHMRAAGANHHEALQVISLRTPEISREYGERRAQGYSHSDALTMALTVAP